MLLRQRCDDVTTYNYSFLNKLSKDLGLQAKAQKIKP